MPAPDAPHIQALRDTWGRYRAADAAFDAQVAMAQDLSFEDSCSAGMHQQVIAAYTQRDRAFEAWLAAVEDAAWECVRALPRP